ncbi:hypothetical protein [uncultured Psychrobacter sp.]|uniref:hypothetical protein n=1 Tax=uncultured Psychrobacter sp. TaxID=259303 RepID=UPI002595258A|nr:hypothetical protein [uncultured Psychrobacter sp.]
MHVGIAGEFRCVVTKADGTVKTDTGYQKNLILNQGLDFFGGGKGNSINASCAIGSGNSTPAITQTKLDAFLALASGSDTTSDYSYVDEGDSLYKVWQQKKYRFTGLDDVNISEVGLVSQGGATNYHLNTRALIKDSSGAPTSISLKLGETLDIYYKTHKVIDTRDKSFVVNLLDGSGEATPYNVIARPVNIGGGTQGSLAFSAVHISTAAEYSGNMVASGELTANNTVYPSGSLYGGYKAVQDFPYVKGSYKKGFSFNVPLDGGNGNIRTMAITSSMTAWQLRFGSVANDSPIVKTNKDILSIPFEISWGRYEGEL